MTRIALVDPGSLLGDELRAELGRRRELWSDLRLLTFDADSEGQVADIDGEAALLGTVSAETLDGVDLVILSGREAAGRLPIPGLGAEAIVLVVSPDAAVADAVVLVDGVNLVDGELPPSARGARLFVSPHPAAVALALLLAPLEPLGLARAEGVLLLPSSMSGSDGLDELLDQTRKILAFQPDPPRAVFGSQLAFNLLPAAGSAALLGDLGSVVGSELPVSLRQVQAPVFHGCTLELRLAFAGAPAVEELRAALAAAPFVDLRDETSLGPIDAADAGDVRVASVEADGGGVWLRAVFDNLTRGGALNALAIVAALVRPAG